MEQTWIVVADAARARIFKTEGAQRHLKEVHDLNHPESQMYSHELRTGGEGAVMDSAGSGMRQPDPQTTTREKHSSHFAKELGNFLQKSRDDNAFTSLILVAEPKFLGRLRDHLDQRTAQLVAESIDKNWAKHEMQHIEKLLKGRTG